jgi:hypothetical protein
VPTTVIGLPALSGRGMKPRASSVLWMVFMLEIGNQVDELGQAEGGKEKNEDEQEHE